MVQTLRYRSMCFPIILKPTEQLDTAANWEIINSLCSPEHPKTHSCLLSPWPLPRILISLPGKRVNHQNPTEFKTRFFFVAIFTHFIISSAEFILPVQQLLGLLPAISICSWIFHAQHAYGCSDLSAPKKVKHSKKKQKQKIMVT